FGEAVDPIERRIDRRGRFLASIVGQDEHDPEVLRQLEWLQLAAVPGRELRSALEEERNVCPELGGKGVKPIAMQRVSCERECGRRVTTSAAEARCDRDSLLDARAPMLLCLRRHFFEGSRDERVVREAGDTVGMSRFEL